jgi:hypothetical protein
MDIAKMQWVLLQQNRIRAPLSAGLLNSKRMDTGGKGSQIQLGACRHDVILKARAQALFQQCAPLSVKQLQRVLALVGSSGEI